MDRSSLIVFLLTVFGAVFFLLQFLMVPVAGQQEAKKLKQRLQSLESEEQPVELPTQLLRERFRRTPSLLETILGRIPGVRSLARSLETPGQTTSGYVYILASLALAILGAGAAWFFTGKPLLEVIAAGILGSMPFFKLRMDQSRRLSLFEEQLGGALDVMIRALQAGYPFTETLRHVAREMQDPIAMEFQMAFDEINAGIDFRTAFRSMLTRVPSLSLMAVATTVALQRETGGNLAESLSNISTVIRGRFVFYRKVKTLTAEGRMSAWVLALMPFILFVMMYFMQPDTMIKFISDPSGQNIIYVGLGLMAAGIFWIRQLLDLDI